MDSSLDFPTFLNRISAAAADPRRAAQAGENLIAGALRIRRGISGDIARPVTKPAEAIGAWLAALQRDDEPRRRAAEAREALLAAAEEVDRAAVAATYPGAARLRSALYSDALTIVGGDDRRPWYLSSIAPWILAALFGGALVGVLVTRKRK